MKKVKVKYFYAQTPESLCADLEKFLNYYQDIVSTNYGQDNSGFWCFVRYKTEGK